MMPVLGAGGESSVTNRLSAQWRSAPESNRLMAVLRTAAPISGDFATAERVNAHLLEVATALNLPFWRTVGRFLEGRLMVERHDFVNGLAVLRDAFEVCRRTGWRISFPEFKGSLAVALAGLGQHDDALPAVNEALADSGQSADGERWYYPELLRIKGEILLQRNAGAPTLAAEECLLEALNVAREQGALCWESRAALSFAQIRVTQGRRDEARQTLMAVHGRFTEGFAAVDSRAARALLDELAK
jgi:predicted ATPase